jgi:hypothetical protein
MEVSECKRAEIENNSKYKRDIAVILKIPGPP